MTRAPRVDRSAVADDVAATTLRAQLGEYQDAVVRLHSLDAVITEMVRLRCARTHDCRICQTLRLDEAAAAGVDAALTDQIDFYERSDLDERIKVALRITDAIIMGPIVFPERLIAQAHEHFSDAELAELLLDITKWSTQKIHVSLGTDGADSIPKNAAGISYLSFAADGHVAGYSAETGAFI